MQGVGYPNRSHDASKAIWQTARFDPAEHKSFDWLGRALDEHPHRGSPDSILRGNSFDRMRLIGST